MQTSYQWDDLPPETKLISPGIRRALDHIATHFAGPIPISCLAALSCLSLHRFVTVFRSQVGIPPHQYICRVRVREARTLLRLGLPAAEVALDTGFCDQSHLTRHFKRQCGITPGIFAGIRAASRSATRTAPSPQLEQRACV